MVGQKGQLPIGIFDNSAYEMGYTNIQPGSTLYLFSDGLYEFQQAKGDIWTYEELAQLLGQQHQQSDRASLTETINKICQIKQEASFEDDCSIVQAHF